MRQPRGSNGTKHCARIRLDEDIGGADNITGGGGEGLAPIMAAPAFVIS